MRGSLRPAPGRITLTEEVRDSQIHVHLRDTGLGIAPEMLSSIFEMFVQVDGSLARSQGGMGLGLTLSQRLVQLHGGTLLASSAGLGHGSEFTVMLPLDPSAAPEAEPPLRAPDGGRQHVLLVEDNEENRDTLQELLQLEGFRVDVAVDGTEGVRRALELKPSVAVIDIGLPGIDGYEVARRVRAELGTSITLVALTGYGQPEDLDRAKQAGFDVSLIKPVDLAALEAAVQAHALPDDRLRSSGPSAG